VALTGNFFEKTVANRTTASARIAAPGDTLRYTLRLRTTNEAARQRPDCMTSSTR
jgi:hypothetical protein